MNNVINTSDDINSKIYLLAAINTLINRECLIDLGRYELECEIDVVDRKHNIGPGTDAAVMFMVKLRDIESGEVDYVECFYKIIKRKLFRPYEGDPIAEENYQQLYNSNDLERLAFILRSETKIIKKMYMTSFYYKRNEFLDEFCGYDETGRLVFKGKKNVTAEAEASIDDALLRTIDDLKATIGKGR